MASLDIISESARETQGIGMRLGKLLGGGEVVLLVGSLGAGKTCLAQGIAWGLGIEEYAMSPSFVIIREYRGRLPLYHIDLYRIERVEEVIDLGLDDYLYGNGVCVVEWAEKGFGALPTEHLLVHIRYLSPKRRSLHFKPRGERYQEILRGLRAAPIEPIKRR